MGTLTNLLRSSAQGATDTPTDYLETIAEISQSIDVYKMLLAEVAIRSGGISERAAAGCVGLARETVRTRRSTEEHQRRYARLVNLTRQVFPNGKP